MKKWIALFSQTGTEIVNISTRIGRWPDIICTNKHSNDLELINSVLLENCFNRIMFMAKQPSVVEYDTVLKNLKMSLITLHGYMRIIPPDICNRYIIYNGHPGDIEKYPILKGKDPQKKACNLNLPTSGSVIHRVSPDVDSGSIKCIKRCDILPQDLEATYTILHKNSTNLWIEFIANELNIKL